jgi:excisionase family DNA binding protein
MAPENDLMNLIDAADLLGVHVQTLRKLAKQKRIPAFKVGREWRFRHEALRRWADEQGQVETARIDGSVLVIDDDQQVCQALSRTLARFGFQTRTATRGADGLELIAHQTPDLVLLDLQMPDMNGPQFLEKLRATHPDLPVVIVTGYPDGDLMQKASRHAPLLLLAKPIEQEPLERTVRTAIGEKMAVAAAGRIR